MTDVKEKEQSVDVAEEEIDELTQKAEALAIWHERAALSAIVEGLKVKIDEIKAAQKQKTVKSNNYNAGYLKALADVVYTINVLLYMTEEDGVAGTVAKAEETVEEANG
jgi:hypothetical protein